jgi:hypothetical protein
VERKRWDIGGDTKDGAGVVGAGVAAALLPFLWLEATGVAASAAAVLPFLRPGVAFTGSSTGVSSTADAVSMGSAASTESTIADSETTAALAAAAGAAGAALPFGTFFAYVGALVSLPVRT